MKYSRGALKSPKDLRNYRIAKATTTIELPEAFELQHSPIKDQGPVGSCVAHALSEVLETKDNINYSTGWIYGYRPEGYYQGTGMYTSEALKTIAKVGYVDNQDFDVNIEMQEAKILVDNNLTTLIPKANQKQVAAYAYLRNINEIKQALYLYKTPVIICFDVDDDGLILDDNYVAQIPDNDCGGHATVCYGWNEFGLLIQNSWGEEWGNKGTFILPYEYPFYEAWLISFKKEKDDEEKEEIIVKPKNIY